MANDSQHPDAESKLSVGHYELGQARVVLKSDLDTLGIWETVKKFKKVCTKSYYSFHPGKGKLANPADRLSSSATFSVSPPLLMDTRSISMVSN